MKKYIGKKQVEAEPMTMGEAYEKGLLRAGIIPNETEKGNPGYHVKYEDGYESWSPAEVFQKAYMVADTHIDRMKIEYDELKERLRKLDVFLGGNKVNELDERTKKLLYCQYRTMIEYLVILNERMIIMEYNR